MPTPSAPENPPNTPPAAVPAPTWVLSSTAGVRLAARPEAASSPAETSPPEAFEPAVVEEPAPIPFPAPLPPVVPLPTVQSPDGKLVLTDALVTVLGQTFGLRELERAEVHHVRWVLWVLLGGLGLAVVIIAFLQNWLHTGPAMLGMATTALLLAYGQRGTNRLRLWLLGRQPAHFALAGELAQWQRLAGELNRRVARAHDRAAAEAAYSLALAEAERLTRQAAEAAHSPAPTFPV
ncbi:MAG TPA: hypothetical protein VFO93_16580 [Hymenobacter sp.]|uniref:hypothetical protein n=1 Tax=Hymenobacter sp. TaxID=1898978 RepID=UPI002D804CBB|nr:hypothetical protein [Hymenobacter sp.]HET9505161.1 hypothetical protein [Hymenobacter sp.]